MRIDFRKVLKAKETPVVDSASIEIRNLISDGRRIATNSSTSIYDYILNKVHEDTWVNSCIQKLETYVTTSVRDAFIDSIRNTRNRPRFSNRYSNIQNKKVILRGIKFLEDTLVGFKKDRKGWENKIRTEIIGRTEHRIPENHPRPTYSKGAKYLAIIGAILASLLAILSLLGLPEYITIITICVATFIAVFFMVIPYYTFYYLRKFYKKNISRIKITVIVVITIAIAVLILMYLLIVLIAAAIFGFMVALTGG